MKEAFHLEGVQSLYLAFFTIQLDEVPSNFI